MTRLGKPQPPTTSRKPDISTLSASSSSASGSASVSVKARRRPAAAAAAAAAEGNAGARKGTQLSGGPADTVPDHEVAMASWTARNRWIVFAVASGACAAFNGVFAKLTTNELSTHIADGISNLFGLTDLKGFVEVVVRASFFGLNLVFNGVMWTLFTQALSLGNSTTQVSIMNTSTNFMITALMGLAIFAESLPPLWWAGAAMLVAGNVIIGRGKQGEEEEAATTSPDEDQNDAYHDDDGDDDTEGRDAVSAAELGSGGYAAETQEEGVLPVEKDDEDEDVALLGDLN